MTTIRIASCAAFLCCLFTGAVGFIYSKQSLEVPTLPLGTEYTDAAISSDYYVTSTSLGDREGVVYVYTRKGDFLYRLFSRAPADGFGLALALNGDDLLVAAPAANYFSGAVYHYSVSQQKLLHIIETEKAFGFFGWSMAVCDEGSRQVVIGAPFQTAPQEGIFGSGAAVYTYDLDTYALREGKSSELQGGLFAPGLGLAVACANGKIAATAAPVQAGTAVYMFDMDWEVLYEVNVYGSDRSSVAIGDTLLAVTAGDGVVNLFQLSDGEFVTTVTSWPSGEYSLGSDIAAFGDVFAVTMMYPSYEESAVVFAGNGDYYYVLRDESRSGSRVAFTGDTVLLSQDYEAHNQYMSSSKESNLPNTMHPLGEQVLSAYGTEIIDMNYVSTGSVFVLGHPTGSAESISARDAGMDSLGDNDAFGSSVATSHMYTVIGAPATREASGDGAVHIYSADHTWEKVIFPPVDCTGGCGFGSSVALLGDWVLVGAPKALGSKGSAYLYSAVSGELLYKLAPNDPGSLSNEARFGSTVTFCGEGDIAIVAAPGQRVGNFPSAGKAWVFKLKTSRAVEIDTLQVEHPQLSEAFGTSLSCVGKHVLAGAPAYGSSYGTAHLYEINMQNESVEARQTFDSARMNDFIPPSSGFGTSVALDGQHAIIGAPGTRYYHDGTVLIYNISQPSAQPVVLTPEIHTPSARFGNSLAVAGGLLVVGAEYDDGTFPRTGAVYVFDFATREQQQKLVQDKPYGVIEDRFGTSIALGGGHLIVGRSLSESSAAGDLMFPEVDVYQKGTAHYFLDMYQTGCDEVTPPAPGAPTASNISAETAVLSWTTSLASCYPVESYAVYIQMDGGSYEQAATSQGHAWASVQLKQATSYRAKIAAVNSLGHMSFSAPSEPFTTLSARYIRFTSNGAELEILVDGEFSAEATSGSTCDLDKYFSTPETDFGIGSTCRITSNDTMMVQLAPGTTISPGDTLNFTSTVSDSVITFGAVEPPISPIPVTGALDWSVDVTYCDDIKLDATAFSGIGSSVYGFEYYWTLESMLVDGAEPTNMTSFEQLFDDLAVSAATVVFPNGTFPPEAELDIAVLVLSPTFSQNATEHRPLRIIEEPLPKITVTPVSSRVNIAEQVTVQVQIDYGRCFLQSMPVGYAPAFEWSITGGSDAAANNVAATTLRVSSDTQAATIPGFVLNDTSAVSASPYTVETSLVLPSGRTVSGTASVDVFAYDPVAYIAGGDHAVFLSEGTVTIDASFSYEPNYCTAFGSCTKYLGFGFTCSYSDGSTCCGLASSANSSTVLDLKEARSCSPEGGDVESIAIAVQVLVTSKATGRTVSSSVRLEVLIDGVGDGTSTIAAEPVLPHSFSGFAGLSPPPQSSQAEGSIDMSSALVTWSVIRHQTSTVIATIDGDTAIFDMSGWPSGEQFVLQATAEGAVGATSMTFYSPSTPSAGTFKVQSNQQYLEEGESLVGLVADATLYALDFVDTQGTEGTGSTGSTGLFYQFTDTIEVFSASNQTIFPVTLLLNEPSSSNRLSALVLAPGEHTLQLSVRNRENGMVQQSMSISAESPYASIDELLQLILNFGEVELSSKNNGVGAFAAALTWAAEHVAGDNMTSVCREYNPSMMMAQEILLRVWHQGADRASQQTSTAIKGLQDLYLLTLPGLCVEDGDLALSTLQYTLQVFESIPADQVSEESCGMMTQILSSVLSLPSLTAMDMHSLQLILQFMDEVLESYCGVSVFSYDSTDAQPSAFLGTGSLVGDISMSSVRTPPGEPLRLDLDGLHLDVDEAAARDLSEQLTGMSDGNDGGFWDVSSYRVSRSSLTPAEAEAEGLGSMLSDVFELNIRQATLPGFRYCNKVPGVVDRADTCVTKRVGSSSVSELRHPIVFTVLADAVSIPGFKHSCQYVDMATNTFSDRGCKVLDATPDRNNNGSSNSATSLMAVTCACDHMTAFAVRQMALQGESDCDDLGSGWKNTYHTSQYKAFVTLMLLAWLALLTTLVLWLRSVAKTIKHTNASLVANLLFVPVCLLRIIYFAMLLHGWDASSNVACVEFGIAGSGSGYGQYAVLVLHDLAEPILLIAFTSVVLYWYELEKSLSGPLSKMLSSRYLSTQTLWLFIAVDVLLFVVLVGVNFGLLAPGNRSAEDTHDAARALLVVQSVVCICEALAFAWFGWAVVKAGGGVDKMRKVLKLLCSSALMFIVMATLQIVFASPDTVSNPRVAYGLYSILLHMIEFAGAAMMIQTLAVNRKDSRTMVGSLMGKIKVGSSTAKWMSSILSTSSGPRASSARVEPAISSKDNKKEKDVELVVSHYDLGKDEYVASNAERAQAVATTATTTTSVAPNSSVMDESSRVLSSSVAPSSSTDQQDPEFHLFTM